MTVTAIDALLDDLNPQQRAAVVHEGSPLLIVAGAGSGKTRVLTRRMAYLMAERGISPGEILAITFTNKAAGEMAARAAALTGSRARGMWVVRPLSSGFFVHGSLVGILATIFYLGLCAMGPGGIPAAAAVKLDGDGLIHG